jgi:signal recognition particle subunit SRP54
MKKLGSLQSLLEMIPGMAGQLSEKDFNPEDMKNQEAILSSMTRKERANYLIIGPSRRSRIARGSGTSVAEVARLIKRFDKLKSMMKKMAKLNKNPQAAQAMMSRLAGGMR